VETDCGEGLCAYAVVLAIGAERRKLGVLGEDRFAGRGVSYCAAYNGMFFRNKVVAVVCGGDFAFS
jgi:thioredoxin reductase (NADPH)